MITQADMNKILHNVNEVLAKMDERIKKLEEAQNKPKTTSTRKVSEDS